jgi:tRNA pseudouridine38-40 synthase
MPSAIHSETEPALGLRTWKLTVAYDGTGFKGWQVQPGERTVQGELQEALRRITGEAAPLPQGSGRTDAGVHALGQVASFELAAPIPAASLLRALNRTLPTAIRVLEAKPVRNTFHARHSAVGKTYEYRIFEGAVCSPFLAPYVYACPWPLKLEALNEAADAFLGEHDFLSFAASDPDLTSRRNAAEIKDVGNLSPRLGFIVKQPRPATARTIFASAWEERAVEGGRLLIYRVRGSGFLHHMVRNLVGSMVEVGRGRLPASAMAPMLAARNRAAAGPTAPAQGLFLVSVEYDEREFALETQ